MQFLIDYGLFLAQTLTFVVATLVLVAGVIALTSKSKLKGRLKITQLNDHWNDMAEPLLSLSYPKAQRKQWRKKCQQQRKKRDQLPRLFVLDFKGDVMASQVSSLRQEVTAILQTAQDEDEVLVRLESPGGAVPGYGLAASQLQRFRDHHIPLTVAVDKIAASGGYLMACVADTILAAPFAIIGSIGVIAQLPNFHRFLQKHNIDFEQITAGEYKRTLSLFGEVDDKARTKTQADLEAIHQIFKDHILRFRELDLEAVATGEYWLAHDALEKNLVDSLQSSDDYLLKQTQDKQIIHVAYPQKKRFGKRIQQALAQLSYQGSI